MRASTSRIFFVATAITAFLYLPLAVNYTWPIFFPGPPRLPDGVNAFVNGRAYSVGDGSVEAVRHVDYARNRTVMGVHTMLGGLALALAMFQFSAKLRTRRPAVHRWIGRAYLALMTTSMLTAIAFLLAAAPVNHFGGRAFDAQLWALAFGTLGSAWYALYAIRTRDMVTHRAWMTYSISLMMTAPLLRVVWIGIQPIIPQRDLLTNLGMGSVMLGVVAPFSGAVAFMLAYRGGKTRGQAAPPAWTYALPVVIAALGSLGDGALGLRLPHDVPQIIVLFHLVPAVIALAITLAGALHARAGGNAVREQRWRWLSYGAAFAPPMAFVLALISLPVYPLSEAVILGGMVGPAVPITLAFALVVHFSVTRKAVSPASSPLTPHAPAEPALSGVAARG